MTYFTHDVKLDPRIRAELRDWLEKVRWTHMVTLAFNDCMVGPERARNRLRNWDGRMNRWILGTNWLKKPDERLLWAAFLEKPVDNPHWHLLIEAPAHQHAMLENCVEPVWQQLVQTGSTVVDRIHEETGAIRYVTKEVRNAVCHENFVHAHEFNSCGR